MANYISISLNFHFVVSPFRFNNKHQLNIIY